MNIFKVSGAGKILILLACSLFFLPRPACSQVYEAGDEAQAYDQLFEIHTGMDMELPSLGMEAPEAPPAGQEFTYTYTGLPRYAFSDSAPLQDIIISAVDNTRNSIDVALYNLSIKESAEALLRAKNRGVRVRIIMDEKHVFPKRNQSLQFIMENGFDMRVMRGRNKSGTMHNKFAICDGTMLMTGSCNWSSWAVNMNYENLEFIRDAKLVNGYRQFWDWMWAQSVPVDRFPGSAGSFTPPPFDPSPSVAFNGTMLPAYVFSPRAGTEGAIIKAIKSSRKSIDVAMFSFFSEKLAGALALAQKNGVKVRMVVDKGQGWQSQMVKFALDNGIKLRWRTGRTRKGMMHHKFAVFDGKLLEAGTYNWTNSAEKSNAENIYFTVDPDRVSAFHGQFKKLYSRARAPSSRDLSHYSEE